ncbi:MAG TPA: thiamine-phosphate kinase, partial [Burkholderiaceae bacterium]|nr:thiamine-phosphate kinase [Burkholderiaceae bacterium]
AAGVPLGAALERDALPVAPELDALPEDRRIALALGGGDDYELLFAAPAASRPGIERLGATIGLTLARIGRIDGESGLRLVARDGAATPLDVRSFDHFR